MNAADWVPIREELRGYEPYGAPQLPDVPVQLNVNENPYASERGVAADIAEAVRRGRDVPQPLSGSRGSRTRERLGGVPRPAGVPDHARQVWAANGSNEVMLQLLAGVRRARAARRCSFAPTYSMYPEYARDTPPRG